jgi:hypothetical protein
VLLRGDQDKPVAPERVSLQPSRIDRARHDTQIPDTLGDQADDLVAEAFLQVDADLRVARQEGAQRLGQELGQRIGVGQNANLAREPARIATQVLAQALGLGQHGAGVLEQGAPGRGRHHALPIAQQERSAKGFFHIADSGAGCRQRQMGPLRPVGDAPCLDHMAEKTQVRQIELHDASFVIREGR